MLGFILFKVKPAITRLLRRLAKKKKKKSNNHKSKGILCISRNILAGHEKYNYTTVLLLNQQGINIHYPVRNKKGLEKVEPLTQTRINAIKVVSKQVTILLTCLNSKEVGRYSSFPKGKKKRRAHQHLRKTILLLVSNAPGRIKCHQENIRKGSSVPQQYNLMTAKVYRQLSYVSPLQTENVVEFKTINSQSFSHTEFVKASSLNTPTQNGA